MQKLNREREKYIGDNINILLESKLKTGHGYLAERPEKEKQGNWIDEYIFI
jgi:hypothetical protein